MHQSVEVAVDAARRAQIYANEAVLALLNSHIQQQGPNREYEDYVHMRNAAWFRDMVGVSEEELENMQRRCSRCQEGKVDWRKEGF